MTTTDGARRREDQGFGLAVLTLLVQVIGTTLTARGQDHQLDALGYALLALSALFLAFRHRFPLPTAILVTGLSVAYHLLHYPSGPTFVALIVLGLSLVRARHDRIAWATATAGLAAWILLSGAGFWAAVTVSAWVFGLGAFFEGLHFAFRMIDKMQADERNARLEKERRQASEERLLIAQELHDVLGHHLSLINVRAGVGRHLLDREPEQARAALDTIKQASAEALREVHSVLDALYPQGQSAPRAPAPRLPRLDELTVDAGIAVHTTISGQARALPAEIDRAAYRIVQEALTNVRRHAGPDATASILIEYREENRLVVQVSDDGGRRGVPVAPASEGNGIGGMRERTKALGGSLHAAPLPGGGWLVRAEFPLPPSEEAPEGAA
ncbi:MAG TPA: sensor histidine kinase [Candidatus Limnocylindrales bacterium]|nr:sensor histidine kinase [Candidatus Limnocylindrales bacterium]